MNGNHTKIFDTKAYRAFFDGLLVSETRIFQQAVLHITTKCKKNIVLYLHFTQISYNTIKKFILS